MNRYERVKSAHAGGVNSAHHQLFACAALACNQNVRVCGADGLDSLIDFANGGALSYQVAGTRRFGDRFAQAYVFFSARLCANAFFTRCAISSGSSGLLT